MRVGDVIECYRVGDDPALPVSSSLARRVSLFSSFAGFDPAIHPPKADLLQRTMDARSSPGMTGEKKCPATIKRTPRQAVRSVSLRVGENRAPRDLPIFLSRAGVHDPELEGHIVTVPEVRMSPDLKACDHIRDGRSAGRGTDTVIAALERNKKFLRGEVARRVKPKICA